MYNEFISKLSTPDPVLLDLTDLPRGIDNYHIDVQISARFTADFNSLLSSLIAKELSRRPDTAESKKQFERFQESYLDMMTVLIHRIKTDLKPTEVSLLQFAVIRFILQSVENGLKAYLENLRTRLSGLRSKSEGQSIVVQEEIFWITKHYNSIIVNINKQLFIHLKQVEFKKLQAIRRLYLDATDQTLVNAMLNPMLLTLDLDSPNFLIETYVQWNGKGDSSNFSSINQHLEATIAKLLPEAPFTRLVEAGKEAGELEIYDELKGLTACVNQLGPSINQRNSVGETFTWLDDPGNFEYLFDPEKQEQLLRSTRTSQGLMAWWQTRSKLRQLNRILAEMEKYTKANNTFRQITASERTRKIWRPVMLGFMQPINLCNLLAGDTSFRDFQRRYKLEQNLSPEYYQELQTAIAETKTANAGDSMLVFLRSLARYRLHLKYFRLAHRLFNRVAILSDNENLQLSLKSGTLYRLQMADEVTSEEARIAHHTILKADVRGSTTVTDALEKQNLNPASYFSLRFFSPINKVLPTYGANKVFIEGDAVILSLLEYEQDPQHWLSVARTCGLAKAMLAVVNANNQYSNQIGLPPLELGIGICYAEYAPRYLYDGEHPIMISSAIGLADRMSSCSWKLRAAIKKNPFNVEVLQIATDDQSRGEKGQQHIRYNVNGILLHNDAFKKLGNEIELTRLTAKINDNEVVFHYGEYPDTQGKIRNLVIREAPVGLWRNDTIERHNTDEKFYEAVTNTRILAGIQDRMYALKGRSKEQEIPEDL